MVKGNDRILRAGGTPYEIGHSLGQRIGPRLAWTVDTYIAQGPAAFGVIDAERLTRETEPWLEGLANRYRQELEGLADGTGVPLRRLAEWIYVEACTGTGCSSVLMTIDGATWVARNNDIWAPDTWGYATIRDHADRIPTLSFGMPGETFTATGINRDRLWLHYHFLPGETAADPPEEAWFEFQWMTEALEMCKSLAEVEAWLHRQPRRGSMLLFAVDGRIGDRAVFECSPTSHCRWPDTGSAILGTNHSILGGPEGTPESHRRRAALEHGVQELAASVNSDPAMGLRDLLADPTVEQHRVGYGTVYSNVACPALGCLWATLGGFPAASCGDWRQIPWPWPGKSKPSGTR